MADTFGSAFSDHDILLVEKYGITDALPYNGHDGEREDCPAETMLNDSLSVRVSDYAAVPGQPKGKYDSVLPGGSEGAIVAEHSAPASPVVDTVVAINGGGRFFLDDGESSRESGRHIQNL